MYKRNLLKAKLNIITLTLLSPLAFLSGEAKSEVIDNVITEDTTYEEDKTFSGDNRVIVNNDATLTVDGAEIRNTGAGSSLTLEIGGIDASVGGLENTVRLINGTLWSGTDTRIYNGSLLVDHSTLINSGNLWLGGHTGPDNEESNLIVKGENARIKTNQLYSGSLTTGDLNSYISITDKAKVQVTDRAVLGMSGNVELDISSGGELNVNGDAYFANGSANDVGPTTATGVISGTDSQMRVAKNLTLSSNKETQSALLVKDGATLQVGEDARLGTYGTAEVTVSGKGSTFTVGKNLMLGLKGGTNSAGKGNLIVENGGAVSVTQDVIVGSQFGSSGDITVTGPHSVLDVEGAIRLGVGSFGLNPSEDSLTVNEGGELNAARIFLAETASQTATFNIGAAAGESALSAGTVNADSITFGEGDGHIVFNHTDSGYLFSPTLSGSGDVDLYSGVTTVTDDRRDGGSTHIYGGTLRASKANEFNANVGHTLESNGVMDLAGYDQAVSAIHNGGTIIFNDVADAPVGTVLTVTGDYTGQNGALVMNTGLGDDSSGTDKLVINGSVTGTTSVSVVNRLGGGAQTVEGIKLIDVAGNSPGDSFVQKGRITAGLYDYSLKQSISDDDWYLTSHRELPANLDPLSSSGDKFSIGDDSNSNIRPESGAYLGNLAAASTLFVHRMHDRTNESPLAQDAPLDSSMWLRVKQGKTDFSNGDQIDNRTDSTLVQGGGDYAQWSSNGVNSLHLGAMLGYAKADTDSHSKVTGYDASGTTEGYSAGLYATWFANDRQKDGLYVDTWAQYAWFNSSVSSDYQPEESYNADGMQASLETGYVYRLNSESAPVGWFIEPQAQAVWSNVKMDNHKEANGTRVKQDGGSNVTTRLGMRFYPKQKDGAFQPYLEANWIRNSQNYSVKFDGVSAVQDGAKNVAEIKAGLNGQLTKNLSVWGGVGQQFGGSDYRDVSASLGIKFAF